jgi:hypothetical protein
MTGRAAGFCAGYSVPGYMNSWGGRGWGGRGYGFGRGFGGGFGRGYRWRYLATGVPGWAWQGTPPYAAPYAGPYAGPAGAASPADELEALKAQAKSMEEGLGQIRARIEELEKTSEG